MSINLIKANLHELKDDTSLILRLLEDYQEKPEGQKSKDHKLDNMHLYEHAAQPILLAEEVARFIHERMYYLGRVIAELDRMLSKVADQYEEFKMRIPDLYDPVGLLKKSYKKAFASINRNMQNRDYNFADIRMEISAFETYLLSIDNKILVADALTIWAPTLEESHIARRIMLAHQESEQVKTKIRQLAYLKLDRKAEDLKKRLSNPGNDKAFDSALGQLLYVAGFDYAIFNIQQGSSEILAYNHLSKIVVLMESTTGMVDKEKIDLIVSRREEYRNFFSNLLEKGTMIHLLIVTSRDKSGIDAVARKEARFNRVAIFTTKEIENLVSLLRKGRLDCEKVVEIISKNMPT